MAFMLRQMVVAIRMLYTEKAPARYKQLHEKSDTSPRVGKTMNRKQNIFLNIPISR